MWWWSEPSRSLETTADSQCPAVPIRTAGAFRDFPTRDWPTPIVVAVVGRWLLLARWCAPVWILPQQRQPQQPNWGEVWLLKPQRWVGVWLLVIVALTMRVWTGMLADWAEIYYSYCFYCCYCRTPQQSRRRRPSRWMVLVSLSQQQPGAGGWWRLRWHRPGHPDPTQCCCCCCFVQTIIRCGTLGDIWFGRKLSRREGWVCSGGSIGVVALQCFSQRRTRPQRMTVGCCCWVGGTESSFWLFFGWWWTLPRCARYSSSSSSYPQTQPPRFGSTATARIQCNRRPEETLEASAPSFSLDRSHSSCNTGSSHTVWTPKSIPVFWR